MQLLAASALYDSFNGCVRSLRIHAAVCHWLAVVAHYDYKAAAKLSPNQMWRQSRNTASVWPTQPLGK